MKKIIAAAVATAFVTPAFADVTLGGLVEFGYSSEATTESTGHGNAAIFVASSTELDNGITAAAAINIDNSNDVTGGDGGTQVSLAGPFGKVEMGDTSSATDKFDDKADRDVMGGSADLSAYDAAISWTLPTLVPGLSTYVSFAPESASKSDQPEHMGLGLQYTAGPVSVAYASNEGELDADDQTYMRAMGTFAGLTVSYEVLEMGAGEKEEEVIGLSYAINDLTISYGQGDHTNDAGATSAEETFFGVKYSLGGGVTLFAERFEDDMDESAEVDTFGVAYAF